MIRFALDDRTKQELDREYARSYVARGKEKDITQTREAPVHNVRTKNGVT